MAQNTLTYRELEAHWKLLRSAGMRVREVACVGAPRTLLCVEYGKSELPAVHLSAGVHGDEPGGVLTLLRVAQDGALDPRFSYRIWPCTNPTGFDSGTRESIDGVDINRTFGRGGSSPEAKAIITANRDRKFVLAVDLHEDDGASEFYAYAYGEARLAERVIDTVIRPDPEIEAEEIGGLSLSLLLRRGAASTVLTLESPGTVPLESRITMHDAAVRALLRLL